MFGIETWMLRNKINEKEADWKRYTRNTTVII
jgi:hypothetical protein